jgi:hypothetical protein
LSVSRLLIFGIVLIAAVSATHAAQAAQPASGLGISIRFLPGHLAPARPGQRETVGVILRQEEAPARPVRVSLEPTAGIAVAPQAREVAVKPRTETPAFFTIAVAAEQTAESWVVVRLDGRRAGAIGVGGCYSLEGVAWKARYDKEGVGAAQGWMSPDCDDSDWAVRRLPSMWQEVGVTYLRARLFVPAWWRGRNVVLRLRAVDDQDVCYLNGVEIGRTQGWDAPRSYTVEPQAIQFGKDNLLCIAVNNTYAGGGIYRTPSFFGVDIPAEPAPPPPHLAAPRPVGDPLPLRRMRVEDGVLLYHDGGEVALWGINYYPQSWYQFENMKRLGVDMKQAICDDLDDMKRMGVEVIRIHVFDREISDAQGNLLDNEHLDLLDCLIAQASERGIYFMFTPIAWWWGPGQNPDSFSARTPKEYMFCDDQAIAAQASYLANWLNHVNRYTGRRYKDEPAICALEIMNEPAYADYNARTPSGWPRSRSGWRRNGGDGAGPTAWATSRASFRSSDTR